MNDTTMAPHRGAMILAFGILGLIVCFPLGIIAWVMGNGDLKQMRDGRMDPSGESLTSVGKILGMVGTILAIFGILIGLVAFALGVLGAAAGAAANNGFLIGF